jgi:hypothetical protein
MGLLDVVVEDRPVKFLLNGVDCGPVPINKRGNVIAGSEGR